MELTEGHWCYIRHEAAARYAANLNAVKDPNYTPVDNSPKDTDSDIEKAIKTEIIRLAMEDMNNTIRLMKAKLEIYNTIRSIEKEVDNMLDIVKTGDPSN